MKDTVNVVFTNRSPANPTHYVFSATLKFLMMPQKSHGRLNWPGVALGICLFQFGFSKWHGFALECNCSGTIRTPKRS